jgi:hypothetical protein
MFQQLDIVTTEVVQGFWEGVFHLSYDLWFALGEVRLWFDLLLVETFAEDSVDGN